MSARSWLGLALLLANSCAGRTLPSDPGSGGTAGAAGAASGEAGAGSGGIEPSPWPGPAEVKALDEPAQFGANLSGLTYQAAQGDTSAVLWAVSNIPGKLYRLTESGSGFVTDPGWQAGKLLRYPSGNGEADAESVTLGGSLADGLYVVSEHDNDRADVSRLSVLRYDVATPGAGADLIATHEWDLTGALPQLQANLGLEAVTWVPDDYLVERGFFDEHAERPYEPGDYPGHGAGLFFVGVEQTGIVYGFALDHDAGASTLLVSLQTPFPGVMGLEHDRDVGQLWVWCDEVCGNQAMVFDIETKPGSSTQGRFTQRSWLARPSGLPPSNHEGIAIGAESECSEGLKPFFWTDDNDLDAQSIRRGHVRCGSEL